ncbi:MAG: Stp1/IreP family PP2C-type Ser/Thr phosphatase [Solirubrobacterales bacterium]
MRFAAKTDIGLIRKQNQDRYLMKPDQGLFVVCDGMGGHKAGEIAAQMAVDAIAEAFSTAVDTLKAKDSLVSAIAEANRRIYLESISNDEHAGMGTTIIAAHLDGFTLQVASIGDSSLFIVRADAIEKVTEDHTLTEKLYREGLLDANERNTHRFRHVLTRALGTEETVEPDVRQRALEPGDTVVISTDGLTDMVEPAEIKDLIVESQDIEKALDQLLQLALDRGGHDNVTMIMIRVERED